MTVNEFHRRFPELGLEPTFSEWAEAQHWEAVGYGHKGRAARFRAVLDLIEARKFLLARAFVPSSDEAVAERLMPLAQAEAAAHLAA